MKHWFPIEVGNEIVMNFLLTFISNLNFKAVEMCCLCLLKETQEVCLLIPNNPIISLLETLNDNPVDLTVEEMQTVSPTELDTNNKSY